jgi:hypothetical protein
MKKIIGGKSRDRFPLGQPLFFSIEYKCSQNELIHVGALFCLVDFLAAGTYKVTATVSLADGTEMTCLFVRLEIVNE